MENRRILFGLSLIVLIAFGCSTKVELNAPYKSTTLVFGLLDPTLDTQWVKINRTWLGDGNNLDYAMIRDSSEYPAGSFTAVVEELVNGIVVNSFPLIDTLLENKEQNPGDIFYAPEHTAYYFVPNNSNLNEEALYRLNIDFQNNDDVDAMTNLIQSEPGSITQPPGGVPNFKFNLASVGQTFTQYPDLTFKWNTTENARRYEVLLNITYVENIFEDLAHTVLVESNVRTINWNLGIVTSSSDAGNETLEKVVNTEQFYILLQNMLDADPYITRELGIWDEEVQIARAFDFVLTVANDELSTYLQINEPVTGIVQDRPEYTNINNGLGLFASRATQAVYGIGYTSSSMKALVEGEYTAALNFCTPNPFSEYYCGN
jgi:hypothetical protein